MKGQGEFGSPRPSYRRGKWYLGTIVSLLGVTAMVMAVLGQPSARAWSGDPTVNTPVCTAVQDQLWNSMPVTIVNRPNIASDGAGGAIIVWYDNRNSGTTGLDIYAQRLDASGLPLWGENGVAVCTWSLSQESPTITGDGQGGAIIAWQDYRGGSYWDIYAQRLNESGVPQWTDGGRAICAALYSQAYPTLISDNAKGAIITWQDNRNATTSGWDIYAQRVDSSGNPATGWPAGGRAICNATGTQDYQTLASDGSGGAIIAWRDSRLGADNSDIYAQKVDSSGNLGAGWPTDGVAVCTASLQQLNPAVVSDDAHGAIIAWQDYRGGDTYSDIYAQRVDSSGSVAFGWPVDGVAVCAAARSQQNPTAVGDGSGGAIIAWHDYRNSGSTLLDIYAQRVDASGAALWTSNGAAICTAIRDQQNPTAVSDDSGGAIITWQDSRTIATGSDVYALRVDSSGSIAAGWGVNGEPISTAMGTQQNPVLAGDGSGGAIIAWRDYRNSGTSGWDLYAQEVKDYGSLPAPPTVTSVDPAQGDRGQSNSDVTITGENFTGVTSVIFGSGVTVNGFTVTSATSITADVTIDPAATLGTRDITVYSPEGMGTLSGGFTVYPELLADFYADRIEVAAYQSVNFSDNCSGGSGSFGYEWDFGDGGTSTQQNPSHPYDVPGTYTVMLTVTDSADNSVTETKAGYITVVAPPDADFSGAPRAILIGQSVSFTDLSGGGVGSLTYDWTFGDGGASNLPNPSHGYGATGIYTVSLTVTDSATNSDTKTKIDYITVVAGPHADFTADDTVAMAGQNIDFTNLSGGGIAPLSYQWDFDNNGSWDGTAEHETHAYSSPGTYTVALRITDAAANSDSEVKVDYITIVQSCGSTSTASGTGTVEICTSAGVLGNLAGVSEDSLPDAGKPYLIFSHGLFAFDITGLTPGQSVTLVITLPSSVPADAQYWKFGPTSGYPSGRWYPVPLGSNDGDNVVTITLRDGGLGDDDLTANGTIIDQGGPGTPRPPEPAPAFPSLWTGVAAALGAAVLAYLIRRALASR